MARRGKTVDETGRECGTGSRRRRLALAVKHEQLVCLDIAICCQMEEAACAGVDAMRPVVKVCASDDNVAGAVAVQIADAGDARPKLDVVRVCRASRGQQRLAQDLDVAVVVVRVRGADAGLDLGR